MRTILTVLILVGIVVFLGVELSDRGRLLDRLLPAESPDAVDFTALKLHDKPNQYLVCPPDFCADTPHRTSPVFELPLAELSTRWQRLIAGEPRIVTLAVDPNLQEFQYIQRTEWVRFPDVIAVKLIALGPDRSTLAIYSRSIYGRSDLGANRARIDGWLAALQQAH
jgi:uncharacterized protein (DUF1499 family)